MADGPVRGTQSFVGVMGSVWRRPGLAMGEMTWRAVAACGFVFVLAVALGSLGLEISLRGGTDNRAASSFAVLQAITVFRPVEAAYTLRMLASTAWVAVWPAVHWLLPEVVAVWLIVAALGRTFVLRRLDPTLKTATWSMLVLGTLRAFILSLVWVLWMWGIGWAARVEITGRGAVGAEPNLVGFCGLLICGTLALYVIWGAASWPLQLAPLLAMRYGLGAGASLRKAFGAGAVRGKLVEINLVLHIVKLALLVLAMVFSASPLPFTNVATQGFLICWWLGVGVLYVAMSDYFQLVRAAAYLRLWNAYGEELR